MGEIPSEFANRTAPSLSELERLSPRMRQYDVFIETTTQMLATPKLHERLLLALEAISTSFGYRQAAIAMINERDAEMRIRAAIGFDGDPSITRVEMPLDSSAACVRVIHDGKSVWISLEDDEPSRNLFGNMSWQSDVLAIPLFGISELTSRPGVARTNTSEYWTFERGARIGVLYVGANRDAIDAESLALIKRFAERIGIVASLAAHQERLVSTVTKLQRERQWIESIMKSVADPIVLTDLDNQILLQNRRAEELFSGSANAGEGKRRA